jgi:hypothetical protein
MPAFNFATLDPNSVSEIFFKTRSFKVDGKDTEQFIAQPKCDTGGRYKANFKGETTEIVLLGATEGRNGVFECRLKPKADDPESSIFFDSGTYCVKKTDITTVSDEFSKVKVGKSKDGDLTLYKFPTCDESGVTIPEDGEFLIEGPVPEKSGFLKVRYANRGYLQRLMWFVSEKLFEVKEKCYKDAESVWEIFAKIKNPVWVSKENPDALTIYTKLSCYNQWEGGKIVSRERAKITLGTGDEVPYGDHLQRMVITGRAVLSLELIIRGKEISPKLQVTSFAVGEIKKIERQAVNHRTIEEYSKNTAQNKKNAALLKDLMSSTSPTGPVEAGGGGLEDRPPASPPNDDIEELLKGVTVDDGDEDIVLPPSGKADVNPEIEGF